MITSTEIPTIAIHSRKILGKGLSILIFKLFFKVRAFLRKVRHFAQPVAQIMFKSRVMLFFPKVAAMAETLTQ